MIKNKRSALRTLSLIVTWVVASHVAQGQLSLKRIPPAQRSQSPANSAMARTQITRLNLPFWDDFSYYTTKKPIDSLWSSYNTVSINDGMAINPVSQRVATFDGYDASGKPYNALDNGLVKGFGDSLVSRPIDLTTVTFEQQETVYLSFYYQAQGNGEVPDQGDKLEIFFRSPLGWELVDDSIEGGYGPDSVFRFKILQVPPRFFFKNFQFKFRNFGRLSGPYDTWNLDYVYINVGRNLSDNSTPDRSITVVPSRLFSDYWSMPYRHFLKNPSTNLSKPSFGLYNFKQGNQQPISFFSSAEITSFQNGKGRKAAKQLDFNTSIGNAIVAGEKRLVQLSAIPQSSDFDVNNDSVSLQLKIGINSKDNVIDDPVNKITGDYTLDYSPIDFRNNDTIRSVYTLSAYYAYDDGTAEYAAGVNQAGAELAYLFNSKFTKPDTVTKIDIHFPNFEDQPNQVFELRIWKSIADTSPSLLYKQTVSVRRKSNNQFSTFVLDPSQPVIVEGTFYVGWKQTTSQRMDVGFDANTDTGSKVFYNTGGTWTQNTDLKGSLMIRPVFGSKKLVTAVENPPTPQVIYPNPNSGAFFIPNNTDELLIYDSTGEYVSFSVEDSINEKKVIVNRSGLFIVRLRIRGAWLSYRILVR